MSETEKHTPLYDRHLRAGAKMVPFAGYSMPVQYGGVLDEHRAVREAVGVFDVSHMGEVFIEGPDAAAAADRLVTNRVQGLEDGQAVYAGMLDEKGGFVDDVIAYKMSPTKILVCVNAANREKDFAHIVAHLSGEAKATDASDDWAQVAVQGPKAPALVDGLAKVDLLATAKFHFVECDVASVPCIVARTGYTGEDGFELFCPADRAGALWDAVVDAGAVPCGLGARDTLRLEYKLALYGNDIDADHDPYEAGLGWVVKLDKGEFVGRDALVKKKEAGPSRKLVGFKLVDKGIPRPHMKVLDEAGQAVGEVTSGTMSPTLREPIGLAYVPVALSEPGSRLRIDLRGRPAAAEVVKTPFVSR